MKKLESFLKNKNEEKITELLSYTHLEDLLIIKKIYDKNMRYKLFLDINNCIYTEEIKIILWVLFYDNLDLWCYFIHKGITENKKELIQILFESSHHDASKIKKKYFGMFKEDILKNIKTDECTRIFLSFLTSNYFFPCDINGKEMKKIVQQFFIMKKTKDIDYNFISYVFQSNYILVIKYMYEENYNENFEDFLDIFPETIQKILKKRTLKETNFQDYLYDIDDSINSKNYFGFLKKLFWISDYIDGYFLYLLNKYISKYKNINFNPTNQNIKFLFKNIIEFNSQNLFISDLIKYMKINHSFPYLYIYI